MVDPQLLGYIKRQLDQGANKDGIRSALMGNGWPTNLIEEAFNSLTPQVVGSTPLEASPAQSLSQPLQPAGGAAQQPVEQPAQVTAQSPLMTRPAISLSQSMQPARKRGGGLKTTLLAIVIVAALGALGFIAFQTYLSPMLFEEEVETLPVVVPEEVASTTPETKDEEPLSFAESLAACTPFEEVFVHSETGESLLREIVGLEDGKCYSRELLPENNLMECRFSESARIAVSSYLIEAKTPQANTSTSTSTATSTPTSTSTVTYMVDGKSVGNPYHEVLTNGTCVIRESQV